MAPTTTAARKAAKAPKAAGAEPAAPKKGSAKKAGTKAGSPVEKPARKTVAKAPASTKAAGTKKAAASKARKAAEGAKAASARSASANAASAKSNGARTSGAKSADGKRPGSQAEPVRARVPALAKRSPADEGKKAPPRRKGPLDKFLLGQLAVLEEERSTYTRQAASLRAEADQLVAEREPGDVQFDEESGEGDTIAVERERDLALSAQAAAAVEDIDRAIAKIHDGTYGVCEQCFSTIPKERLRALPYAALCVQCKSAGFSSR